MQRLLREDPELSRESLSARLELILQELYTKDWTLIRGARVRGRPRTDKRCLSCGAPLSINMAGQCTHCSARVTPPCMAS